MTGTRFPGTLAAVALAGGLLLAAPRPAAAGSDTPPQGPPWVRDFHQAQERGLKEGLPIFVYLTKTH